MPGVYRGAKGLVDMAVGRADKIISAKRAGGFTLAELLVVVLIIAIVAAIMFPVLIKAKEYARISQCLSNLREIGGGLQMYLNEYDDCFPAAVPWGPPQYCDEYFGQKTFQELVSPYVRNKIIQDEDGKFVSAGVFRCPSDKGMPASVRTPFSIPPNKPIWKYTGCSYEYYASNQYDCLDGQSGDPVVKWTGLSPEISRGSRNVRVGAPMSAVIRPTKKAVLGDIWLWHLGDEVPIERIRFRDTLFADGHAMRVRGIEHLEARIQQLKPRWHSFDEVDVENEVVASIED